MKIPEGFDREDLEGVAGSLEMEPKTVEIEDGTGYPCHLETAAAYAARFIRTSLAAAPTPPTKNAELHDIEIRGIALECGFKLKPQSDGTEDLNPYVYQFAREILATMPSVEEVASFAKAMSKREAPPATAIARGDVKSLTVVGHGWNEKYEIDSFTITSEFGLTCYVKHSEATPGPKGVKVEFTKDWCMKMAKLEGDSAIGAGVPEVEPVGDITISHYKGYENRDFDYYGNLPDGTHKLYTHPAADGLRKAAEEVAEALEKLSCWPRLQQLGRNLRAELDKKS